jgi:phosphate uptake regulator
MPSMTLEELEASLQNAEPEEEEEFDDSDESMATEIWHDLDAALDRLKKASLLLDYMSDPVLCLELGQTERNVMGRMADEISQFVTDMEESYE